MTGHALVRLYERTSGAFTAVCECGQLLHGNYERDAVNAHANHEQDRADEALRCPNGCYLGCESSGETVSRAVAYSPPGGSLTLLRCPDCRLAWATGAQDEVALNVLALANFGIAS